MNEKIGLDIGMLKFTHVNWRFRQYSKKEKEEYVHALTPSAWTIARRSTRKNWSEQLLAPVRISSFKNIVMHLKYSILSWYPLPKKVLSLQCPPSMKSRKLAYTPKKNHFHKEEKTEKLNWPACSPCRSWAKQEEYSYIAFKYESRTHPFMHYALQNI